jgi:tetratricopeptide (TPR) repeat protein
MSTEAAVAERVPLQDEVEALLGGGLPPDAQAHLAAAADSYADGEVALEHLREAEKIAGNHPAVLIGLYRFYFYKGRLSECLEVAHVCLAEAAYHNNLAADWREVSKDDATFGSYDDMMPRFYMFVLKGYAYLQMRLGNLDEGLAAAMKLLELDPTDKIGATLLLEVHQRMLEEDDDAD